MSEVVSLMDIDEDDNHQKQNNSQKLNKGKGLVTAADTKPTPWVEKYRPQSLADVAAHRDIVDTIDRLTSENRLPHLLLYGPPGTGKTSTILAVARKLYGSQYRNMILELNASDDRGIDVLFFCVAADIARAFVTTFIQSLSFDYLRAKSSVKLILLDEADAMTKDAQFALRRVIEKYTKNTRFALICNHVNKIIPALQSRCTRFRFAPLDPIHVTERLKHVVQAERLDVPDCGLAALVRLSNGDMRKALNILQVFKLLIPILFLRKLVYNNSYLFKKCKSEKQQVGFDLLFALWQKWMDFFFPLGEGGFKAGSYGDVSEPNAQSTHMASQKITEEAVYLCTGNPLPKDIEQISYWLLNESFAESFKRVSETKTRKGLALIDIVREVTMFVFKIKMPSDVRVQLINDLADIEYRLSFGCNDKLQLGSLIAIFTKARSSLVAAVK
ncbi:hypothetical protein Godav_009323 [Gossypium davidsonii]|uniref:AAA+ ATPase domain-containing protein n=1 Tax=Gossypium davidsonii TaxID=34287 RepID=A0A7J8SCR2_GOSDV|nr:hypothetical protein [Gossypium davidsonii]